MKSVTRFFDIVYWIFMTSCKLCFIGMVLITAAVVFNRYVLKSPMTWGEPVVLMCMVYMSLVSAALAIRKDSHIRMQLIDFLAPAKAVAAMRIAAQIGIFVFGLFLLYYGWEFTFRVARRNIMTGVGIRSTWLYLANPVAGFAICLMEIERAINFIDRWRRGEHMQTASMEEEAKAFVKDTAEQLDGGAH